MREWKSGIGRDPRSRRARCEFLEAHGATAENIKMWTEQALTDIGFTTEKLMAQE